VTFAAPNTETVLTFELTGAGSGNAAITDTVDIDVRPLVADAGADRVVTASASGPLRLTLDSQSRSGEEITGYGWEQTAGPTDVVELGDTMQPTLAITLTLTPEIDTLDLAFTLTVSNTLGQDSDTVNVLLREALYLPLVLR
jgi:hypothetical protein